MKYLVTSLFAFTLLLSSCSDEETLVQKETNSGKSKALTEIKQMEDEYRALLARQPQDKSNANARVTIIPSFVDLTDYVPQVGDQDQDRVGSCVSYACSYIKGFHENYERNLSGPNRAYTMSAINLFARVMATANSCTFAGSYIVDNLNQLTNQGICLESELPYEANKCIAKTDSRIALHSFFNKRFKISSYRALGYSANNYAAIKDELANNRPVLLGVSVDKQFRYYKGDASIYNFTYNPAQAIFGHGIACIGYDEGKKAFKLINSYGTGWGDNGYIWISEKSLNSYITAAYAMTDLVDAESEPGLTPIRELYTTYYYYEFYPVANSTLIGKGFDGKANDPDYTPVYAGYSTSHGSWQWTKNPAQYQYMATTTSKTFYTKNDKLPGDDSRLTKLYFHRNTTNSKLIRVSTSSTLPGYTMIEELGYVIL